METPDVYILAQVDWEFFCTLTYRSGNSRLAKIPEQAKVAMLFQWLRSVAKRHVHFRQLLWAARPELGEMGGRFHWHVLLGGTNRKRCMGACHEIRALWSGLERDAGMARVTVFDPLRDAGSYLTKGETGWADNSKVSKGGLRLQGEVRLGGDVHESAKFGQVEKLIIAKRVFRYVAENRGLGDIELA